MADKETPAGTTDAGNETQGKAVEAQASAERDRCASIAKLCNDAGMSNLTDGFIAAGTSVEDVKAKVDASAEIKTLCAQAKKLMPAMDVEAMAKEFSAKGVSPEVARAALWDKIAEASEAVNIVNTLSPQAVANPTQKDTLDAAEIWARRNGRKQ